MGMYEDKLKDIVTNIAVIRGDLDKAVAVIPDAAEELFRYVAAFRAVADSPGIDGITGSLVSLRLTTESDRAAENAWAILGMPSVLNQVLTSISAAEIAYNSLPGATVSKDQQAAVLAGANLLLPGLGLIGGQFALDRYEERLSGEREKAAKNALNVLRDETTKSASTMHHRSEGIDVPTALPIGPGEDDTRPPQPKHPQKPDAGGRATAPGSGLDSGGSDAWDQQLAADGTPAGGMPPGGVAAGVVGAGAAAGLVAGLGKVGGSTTRPGLAPGMGGSGGSGGGAGTGGIGAGSRVSADSANTVSRLSSGSGSSGLNGGLASGRSGLGGFGSGAGGLAGGLKGLGSGAGGVSAGSGSGMAGGEAGLGGRAGLGGSGSAGGGSASGAGSAGGAGGRSMMMGAGGGGAGGGDKDKSRGSLGYRAPKIEADTRGRVRTSSGEAGSRADFPGSGS